MISKEIICCGKKYKLACDGNCSKAWGINNRPTIQIDENNEDDYAYLSDDELGIAPEDMGTYECNDGKPIYNEEKLNKWCYRECERSKRFELNEEIILDDFSKRVYNIKR